MRFSAAILSAAFTCTVLSMNNGNGVNHRALDMSIQPVTTTQENFPQGTQLPSETETRIQPRDIRSESKLSAVDKEPENKPYGKFIYETTFNCYNVTEHGIYFNCSPTQSVTSGARRGLNVPGFLSLPVRLVQMLHRPVQAQNSPVTKTAYVPYEYPKPTTTTTTTTATVIDARPTMFTASQETSSAERTTRRPAVARVWAQVKKLLWL